MHASGRKGPGGSERTGCGPVIYGWANYLSGLCTHLFRSVGVVIASLSTRAQFSPVCGNGMMGGCPFSPHQCIQAHIDPLEKRQFLPESRREQVVRVVRHLDWKRRQFTRSVELWVPLLNQKENTRLGIANIPTPRTASDSECYCDIVIIFLREGSQEWSLSR
jgi:hypothetical protein